MHFTPCINVSVTNQNTHNVMILATMFEGHFLSASVNGETCKMANGRNLF